MFDTSKRQSEPQFMRNIDIVARNGLKIANSLGCAFHFESEFRTTTSQALDIKLFLLITITKNNNFCISGGLQ